MEAGQSNVIGARSSHRNYNNLAHTVDLADIDSLCLEQLLENHAEAETVNQTGQTVPLASPTDLPVVGMLARCDTHGALQAGANFGMAKGVVPVCRIGSLCQLGTAEGILRPGSRCSWLLNKPEIVVRQLLRPLDGLIDIPDYKCESQPVCSLD